MGIKDGHEQTEPEFEWPATESDDKPTQNDVYLKRAYLKHWLPEDAIVEIFSQNAADTSSIVELSLRENLIRYRCDLQKDGSRKFFVLPEDEYRAREIVHEIKDGTPPK